MNRPILIVDDSPTLRTSLSFCLENAGYQTIQSENGQEGLDTLTKLKEEGKSIGLIITDINMPVMDGIGFIREVKATSFRFVPILVLSTETERSLKDQAKEAGAAGWLNKPFRPEQLLWVVKKFIRV
ncbi:MAG: two-component system response regulator [Deltaproteobacteria bacterium RBG_13_43_22]|nr:MAG: two-component system response regulator [Deltaproteobacteria bacterium RBG_13_43_22]